MLDNLDERGRRILQNFGIAVASVGLLWNVKEIFTDSNLWHIGGGILVMCVGAVFIWPAITAPLASLGSTIAPFMPFTKARAERKSGRVSETMIVRAIERAEKKKHQPEQ